MRAAIELIDDLEDRVLQLLAGCFRCEQPPYSKVGLRAQFLRDQRIGCFLDTVVEERIGIFRAEDEARSERFPKLAVLFLVRVLEYHLQLGGPRSIAQAG